MRPSAANTSSVSLTDGRVIFFSYGVAVAAIIPGVGRVKDETHYSVTTSKHVNGAVGKDARAVSPEEFARLIAPIAVRG